MKHVTTNIQAPAARRTSERTLLQRCMLLAVFTILLISDGCYTTVFAAPVTINPGSTPNWTATAVPPQQGVSTDIGYTEQVIARWEEISLLTYASSAKTVSLMAFHGCGPQFGDEGIAKVEFIANNGAVATVTAPSVNPATGRWEWWAYLAPLATDGMVEVRAIVYPHAGLCRVLQGGYVTSVAPNNAVLPTTEQSVVLKSNAQGTYTKTPIWVSLSGNDTTGNGTQGNPYATIQKAVETGYANAASYGTIYLTSGTHLMYRTTYPNPQSGDGWLTIMPAPGVTRDQVVFSEGMGPATTYTRTKLVHFQDVTLSRQASPTGMPLARGPSVATKCCFWLEGCKVIGQDSNTLISGSTGLFDANAGTPYVTNSPTNRAYWQYWSAGPGWVEMVLGCDVYDTSGDCFTADRVVRDFTASRMVEAPGNHPDLYQSTGNVANRFMIDGKAVDCDAQLLFMDDTVATNTNVALVNLALKVKDGNVSSAWGPSCSRHDLFWNCQFIGQQFLFVEDPVHKGSGVVENPLVSGHGNIFAKVNLSSTTTTTTYLNSLPSFQWTDNFYVTDASSWYAGTGILVGNPGYVDLVNGDYRPTAAGSTTRTVRWDINQNPRSSTTLRGAYAGSGESQSPPVITSALTATGTNGSLFTYSIWATNNPSSYGASNLPTGVAVNTATGFISGTPAAAGTFSAPITATNAVGTGSATLVLTVLPPPPVITSALTKTGTSGSALSYTITATNSPTSYDATNLPNGVNVNTATGVISGTPTVTGTFSSTISATNAGGTGSATLVLTILQPPPAITSALTATGTSGSAFSYSITATNNPTSYGATNLPSGVTVNTATGVISGTPTATGTFSSTISATNAGGTGSATLVLTIQPPAPVITSALTASGTAGVAFSYNITATNNPTSYGATNLPSGVTVNTATGVISGTPTATGTFSSTISATNAGGTGSATLVLTVATGRLIYEPFDYAVTNNLGTSPDSPSDIGFMGTTWATSNKVVAPGLTYGTMPVLGNTLQYTSNVEAARLIDMTRPAIANYGIVDTDGVTRIGKPGTTIWLSFLIQPLVSDTTTLTSVLRLQGSGSGSALTKMQFGDVGSPTTWSMKIGSTVVSGTDTIVTGSTVRIVARISYVAGTNNDEVDLYVNPPVGPTPPASPSASFRGGDLAPFDRVDIVGNRQSNMDEVSFATDWGSL